MSTKTLVSLISPPSRAFNHYRPPMALLSLAGYLIKQKVTVKIIDIVYEQVLRDKKFWENVEYHRKVVESRILKKYKTNPSPIVGITCYTPEYQEVWQLAKKIKIINPLAKIIIGGIHPTLYPEELLLEDKKTIDIVVIGEGEQTLYEITQELTKKMPDYSKISGIAYIKKNNIIKTPNRKLQDNLDDLYHPAFNLIDMDYYTTASPYSIRGCFLRSFYLLATRGCPSTCTFCVANKLKAFNGGGKCTRIRSAKSLISEILLLKRKYKIDSFYFIDDLLTINKPNVMEFCRLMKSHKINLLWGCSSKVSTLNEELLKNMSQAGCIQIDLGIERGSNEALNLVKKGINLKMVENVHDWCKKYGIRVFDNFLINLPGETKKDLLDINKLIIKLNPDIVTINTFIPYPGTEIYDNHTYKFRKSEYIELFNSTDLINQYPKKYRFAKHRVDLNLWASKYNRQFNRILPTISFHLSKKYLKTLLNSANKIDYLRQFKLLFLEFVNQKFFRI